MAAVVVTGTPIQIAGNNVPHGVGDMKLVVFQISVDTGQYATGGFALPGNVSPSSFGLSQYVLVLTADGVGTASFQAVFNRTTNKVQLFQDNSVATAAPFPEVANNQALVASTFDFIAFGI